MANDKPKLDTKRELESTLRKRAKLASALSNAKVWLEPEIQDWWRVKVGGHFAFGLSSHYRFETAGTVFPLAEIDDPDQPTYWLSWRESWRRTALDEFAFVSASLRVYEGVIGGNADRILRAEWDTHHREPSRRAGQPHWHVESEWSTAAGRSLSRVHLPMGGWENSKDVGYWCRAPENSSDLLVWLERLLPLLQVELRVDATAA